MAAPVIPALLRDHVRRLADEDQRLGNRGQWEARDLDLTNDVILRAEGSARVRLGDTIVIAGVKFSLREPWPDRPTHGSLMTSAEVRPIAGPNYSPGPPSPAAIELGRVVDRGIRESGCVDMEALCILPGEKVWNVNLDCHVLSDRGNLFDACGLAAITALRSATLPAARFDIGEDGPLPVAKTPIICTYQRVGGRFVYDPDHEEELAGDERLCITLGDDGHLHSLQKGLTGAFTSDEFDEMFEHAQKRTAELRKKIDEVVG